MGQTSANSGTGRDTGALLPFTSPPVHWSDFDVSTSGKPENCKQEYLNAGSSFGGTYPVDVDAFCYADVDYIYDDNPITKGVWTKFSSNTKVTCKGGQGSTKPYCVSYDPS